MTLEARDLSFSYVKGTPLWDGVSLVVEPGERVALRAPSGFGKTTFCRMLAGYLEPDEGAVFVDGEPLVRRGRRPVQMVGQHPERSLDPRMRMSASLHEAGEPDRCILDALGIRHEWMTRYPHELSGGELQRFCIARVLTARPRYIVADEISTMLDAVTQARIWRLLIDEVHLHEMGLVFVSHSPALIARVATRVVDMERMRDACVRRP